MLVAEDGVLELEDVGGCGYDGGFSSMGCEHSGRVYHWDLVASAHEREEEHFNSTSLFRVHDAGGPGV